MTNKIRVLQITHDLQIGGLQQVVVNICRTIDRDKFDVVVLCLRELGELTSEIEKLGVNVILLQQKSHVADYLSFLKVVQILKQERIDVIHSHNTQPFFDGTIASILAGVKTVIHTDHARKFPDKKRYMFAEWLMSHFAFKVVGVSEHTSDNLHKYEKISRKKLMTITNGIDVSVYDISIDENRKKQELGLDEGAFVLGLGVRLIEQKGISCLIYAVQKALQKIPNLVLIVAGEGDYKHDLETLVSQLGLEEHIKFLGSRSDIPQLLKIMDIYVLPSYSEGLPMVILEAMAAGCPIISTDVGGISSAIKHEINGILVQPKNINELAEAIIGLFNSEGKRRQFSSEGKFIFNAKFSAKTMVGEYEKLYRDGFTRCRSCE